MTDLPKIDVAAGRLPRSNESLAFEQMWLRLPHGGAISEREAFQPRLAKAFLRHIVLVQVPLPADEPTLHIRLVGDAIREQVQGEMIGLNYLDFLEGEIHRVHAVTRMRELFEKPCDHCWVAPVHYEREFSQFWEITAFPLAASAGSPAVVLALVRPLDALIDGRRTGRRVIGIDPAVKFEVIEIQR